MSAYGYLRTFHNMSKAEEKASSVERRAWRFLFIHVQMVEVHAGYSGQSALMKETLFVGDGFEELVQLLVAPIHHFAESRQQTLELRKIYKQHLDRFRVLKWDGLHNRNGHRDWVFRKGFADVTQITEWSLLLKPWGLNSQTLYDLLQPPQS